MVGGESSNQAMSIISHVWGQPRVHVTSSIIGIIASLGQVAIVAQPVVIISPTNINVVPPHLV